MYGLTFLKTYSRALFSQESTPRITATDDNVRMIGLELRRIADDLHRQMMSQHGIKREHGRDSSKSLRHNGDS